MVMIMCVVIRYVLMSGELFYQKWQWICSYFDFVDWYICYMYVIDMIILDIVVDILVVKGIGVVGYYYDCFEWKQNDQLDEDQFGEKF